LLPPLTAEFIKAAGPIPCCAGTRAQPYARGFISFRDQRLEAAGPWSCCAGTRAQPYGGVSSHSAIKGSKRLDQYPAARAHGPSRTQGVLSLSAIKGSKRPIRSYSASLRRLVRPARSSKAKPYGGGLLPPLTAEFIKAAGPIPCCAGTRAQPYGGVSSHSAIKGSKRLDQGPAVRKGFYLFVPAKYPSGLTNTLLRGRTSPAVRRGLAPSVNSGIYQGGWTNTLLRGHTGPAVCKGFYLFPPTKGSTRPIRSHSASLRGLVRPARSR